MRIRNVQDVKREIEKKQKEEWLQQAFFSKLGISSINFLEIFKNANMKFAGTSKFLNKELRVKLSDSTIKNMITRLYEQYPGIYDIVLSEPPTGCKPRVSKVIKIY